MGLSLIKLFLMGQDVPVIQLFPLFWFINKQYPQSLVLQQSVQESQVQYTARKRQ